MVYTGKAMGDRDFDIMEIIPVFRLISVWGTAVENGENADQALAELRAAHAKNPDLVDAAVDFAHSWQDGGLTTSPKELAETHPSHQAQRAERNKHLKVLLQMQEPVPTD